MMFEQFDKAMLDFQTALRRAGLPFLAMKVPVAPVRTPDDFLAAQQGLSTIYALIRLRPPPAKAYERFMESLHLVERLVASLEHQLREH